MILRLGIPSILTCLAAGALGACSASVSTGSAPTEDVGSTSQALLTGAPIAQIGVASTDTTVTVTYQRNAFFSQYQVTLTGPNGTTTLGDSNLPNGLAGVTFTGLYVCASYTYSIFGDGKTLETGTINTRLPGGGICPLSEALNPTSNALFRGVDHERFDHSWCTSDSWNPAYKTYPLSSAWHFAETDAPLAAGGGVTVNFGFEHWYDPGSDPAPCGERFVDARRVDLQWVLDDTRLHRAQSAVLKGTIGGDPSCLMDVALLARVTYPITSAEANNLNDYGAGWASVIGELTSAALERRGERQANISKVGGQLSADLSSQLSTGVVEAGFTGYLDDGFPEQNNSSGAYAQETKTCWTTLSNVALTLGYAALPPETPHHCSVTKNCTVVTATCDGLPDTFQLHEVTDTYGDRVISTVYPATTAPQMVANSLATEGQYYGDYYVCTIGANGQSTCTGTLPFQETTCSTGTTTHTGGGGDTSGSGTGSSRTHKLE